MRDNVKVSFKMHSQT